MISNTNNTPPLPTQNKEIFHPDIPLIMDVAGIVADYMSEEERTRFADLSPDARQLVTLAQERSVREIESKKQVRIKEITAWREWIEQFRASLSNNVALETAFNAVYPAPTVNAPYADITTDTLEELDSSFHAIRNDIIFKLAKIKGENSTLIVDRIRESLELVDKCLERSFFKNFETLMRIKVEFDSTFTDQPLASAATCLAELFSLGEFEIAFEFIRMAPRGKENLFRLLNHTFLTEDRIDLALLLQLRCNIGYRFPPSQEVFERLLDRGNFEEALKFLNLATYKFGNDNFRSFMLYFASIGQKYTRNQHPTSLLNLLLTKRSEALDFRMRFSNARNTMTPNHVQVELLFQLMESEFVDEAYDLLQWTDCQSALKNMSFVDHLYQVPLRRGELINVFDPFQAATINLLQKNQIEKAKAFFDLFPAFTEIDNDLLQLETRHHRYLADLWRNWSAAFEGLLHYCLYNANGEAFLNYIIEMVLTRMSEAKWLEFIRKWEGFLCSCGRTNEIEKNRKEMHGAFDSFRRETLKKIIDFYTERGDSAKVTELSAYLNSIPSENVPPQTDVRPEEPLVPPPADRENSEPKRTVHNDPMPSPVSPINPSVINLTNKIKKTRFQIVIDIIRALVTDFIVLFQRIAKKINEGLYTFIAKKLPKRNAI